MQKRIYRPTYSQKSAQKQDFLVLTHENNSVGCFFYITKITQQKAHVGVIFQIGQDYFFVFS